MASCYYSLRTPLHERQLPLKENIPMVPYGDADFISVSKSPFYMDRTQYIPLLETSGKHLVFLRPRCTGKSLFIDTLHKYYDVLYEKQFTDIFGHLKIGKNPTDLATKYLVFKIDFSNLNTDTVEDFERSMNDKLNTTVRDFMNTYQRLVPQIVEIELTPGNGVESFTRLCRKVKQGGQKIMVLVDEYDNPMNQALANMSSDMALNLKGSQSSTAQRQNNIFQTFFSTLKSLTSGGAVERIFITGVSPITLNDFTIGFNIVKGLSMDPKFAQLAGFTEDEVKRLLRLVLTNENDVNLALEHLQTHYNGYCFSSETDTRMYISQLVFHALKFIHHRARLPTKGRLLDKNVLPSKYAMELMLATPAERESIETLIENDVLASNISKEESSCVVGLVQEGCLNETLNSRDLLYNSPKSAFSALAFLYHMGVVTQGVYSEYAATHVNPDSSTLFKVPNQVVKKLFLEALVHRMNISQVNFQRLRSAVEQFAQHGDLDELCKCMEHFFAMFKGPNMKYQTEASFKMLFLVALASSRFAHQFENEKRLSQGRFAKRVDLCVSFPQRGYLVELKDVQPGYLRLHGEKYIDANAPWDEIHKFANEVHYHWKQVVHQCVEDASVEALLERCSLEVKVFHGNKVQWVPIHQEWEKAKEQAEDYAQRAANRHHKPYTAHVAMKIGFFTVIHGVAGIVKLK